jgi:hypothetical protein
LDALMATVATHPIVVLVANNGEFHALIIRAPNRPMTSVRLNRIQAIKVNGDIPAKSDLLSWALVVDRDVEDRIRFISSRHSKQLSMLGILWEVVVKPVIDYLELPVRWLFIESAKY